MLRHLWIFLQPSKLAHSVVYCLHLLWSIQCYGDDPWFWLSQCLLILLLAGRRWTKLNYQSCALISLGAFVKNKAFWCEPQPRIVNQRSLAPKYSWVGIGSYHIPLSLSQTQMHHVPGIFGLISTKSEGSPYILLVNNVERGRGKPKITWI